MKRVTAVALLLAAATMTGACAKHDAIDTATTNETVTDETGNVDAADTNLSDTDPVNSTAHNGSAPANGF